MPRRAARRRGKQRRSRRGVSGRGIMPVCPGLHSPGFFAGVLGRWLAGPSRLGISRALLAVIGLTALIWVIVWLSLING